MILPAPLERLVAALARLPGVGERTATRLAFHVLDQPREYATSLAEAVIAVKDRICTCTLCNNIAEAELCPICADPGRDRGLVCVVESVPDLLAIEQTGEYGGTYHVLHGALAPLRGIGPSDLRLDGLVRRAQGGGVREVVVATNVDVEGEATALYVRRLVAPHGVRVTRIASGVPMGGDLEYMDRVTLVRALTGRREM
ncbi:MAG: recombination protein RecR [Myxococcales bacterium]